MPNKKNQYRHLFVSVTINASVIFLIVKRLIAGIKALIAIKRIRIMVIATEALREVLRLVTRVIQYIFTDLKKTLIFTP